MTDAVENGNGGWVPPSDYQAEQAVIGSCLIDPVAFSRVFLEISDGSPLYWQKHQTIWLAIRELHEQGHQTDFVTVSDLLRRWGKLEEVGGDLYLSDLAEAPPMPKNAGYYAGIVADKYRARRLHDLLEQAATSLRAPGADIEDSVITLQHELSAVNSQLRERDHDGRAALQEVGEEIDRLERGERTPAISTQYRDLDDTMGWMNHGDLLVLGAKTSVGKTMFALNLALRLAVAGVHVLFHSCEMDRKLLLRRMMSAHAFQTLDMKLSYAKIRSSREYVRENRSAIDRAFRSLYEMIGDRVHITDNSELNILQLRAVGERILTRHPRGRLVVFGDYLQLIPKLNARANRFEAIAENAWHSKKLAMALGVPVMMLSQFNREADALGDDEEPWHHHLFGASEIEKDSDTILLLHRPKRERDPETGELQPDRVRRVIVSKNRNGPTGRVVLPVYPEFNVVGGAATWRPVAEGEGRSAGRAAAEVPDYDRELLGEREPF